MRVQILALVVLLVCSVAFADKQDGSEQISEVEQFRTWIQNLNGNQPHYFEQLRLQTFGTARSVWNGIINGFNNWNNYKLKDWCMNSKFQDYAIAGMMMFFFKTITGQYINLLQLFYDFLTAIYYVRDELVHCKGKKVVETLEEFWLKTPLIFEAATIAVYIVQENIRLAALLLLTGVNVFSFDFYQAGIFVGKIFKEIDDTFQTIGK